MSGPASIRALALVSFELSLWAIAAGLAKLTQVPLRAGAFSPFPFMAAVLVGAVGFGLFVGLERPGWRWLRRIREFLDQTARPLFAGMGPLTLTLVAAAAGIGEESLFRGWLQPWLATRLDPWIACAAASFLFGAASERRLAPLYFAASVSAFSGIAYELLLATYATFLLGATIFQYSLVLSLMMASMGAGSLLAERFASTPSRAFLASEMVISGVAIAALPALYYAYAQNWFPSFFLMIFVVLMGLSIGMEIPLLGKLAGTAERLPHLLFYDYLGGFLGGLVFPLILVPRMSLFQIAGVLAVINATVSFGFAVGLRGQLGPRRTIWILGAAALLALSAVGAWKADALRAYMEQSLFGIGAAP